MRDEVTDYSPSQLDFVPRERRNQSFKLIIAFVLIIALVFVTSYSPTLRLQLYGPIVSLLAIALLCLYVVLQHQRSLDLVMHTEFQNLLFSQALALGSSFCIFVRRDGTVAYASDGLREIFSQSDYTQSHALEALWSKGKVSLAEQERVVGAIYSNAADRIIFPLALADGTEKLFILTLEPFVRPSGYVLIRGREYRGERVGAELLPNLLRTTSADKLDHLLNHTPVMHYAADAFGRLEYVNQAFETCLGFEAAEVAAMRLNLKSVLHRLGEHTVSDDYTVSDYAGSATVRRKDGQLIDCLLFQTALRDERGKVTGATGSMVVAGGLDIA